jgi:uncharacterized protein YaaQ
MLMKVLFVIVQRDDVSALASALTRGGYRMTRYASTGGFLRRGNETFLIGLEDEQVEGVIALIGQTCRPQTQPLASPPPGVAPSEFVVPFPTEIRVGGAIVFVLPADQFLHL